MQPLQESCRKLYHSPKRKIVELYTRIRRDAVPEISETHEQNIGPWGSKDTELGQHDREDEHPDDAELQPVDFTSAPSDLMGHDVPQLAKSHAPVTCTTCENLGNGTGRMTAHELIRKVIPLGLCKDAAEKGCATCQGILDAIEAFSPGFTRDGVRKSLVIRQVPTVEAPIMTVEVRDAGSTAWSSSVALLDITDEDDADAESTSGIPDASSMPDAEPNFDEIMKMLRDCKCYDGPSRSSPHRLVYIDPNNGNLRLIEDPPSYVRYCCLSYCWGNNATNIQTTRATLAKHLENIDPHELPKTLADAITVCKGLKISYIWIDSLCIIQNDIEQKDWVNECGQMAQIYSNAYIVIAAHSASDCLNGFLKQPIDSAEEWVTFSSIDSSGKSVKKAVKKRIPSLHNDINYIRMRTPLALRAWTLQETLLARRLLHFTEKEIVWECMERMKCNCGQELRSQGLLRLQHVPLEYSRADWHHLVECYSIRELSTFMDRMPAMAAITSNLAARWRRSPQDFLAGIWKMDLVRGLLWCPSGAGPHFRPANYIAPSWSWASLKGGVGCPSFAYLPNWGFTPKIVLLASETTPKSPANPFGEVIDGFIEVQGRVVQIDLALAKSSFRKVYGDYDGGNGRPSRVHNGQTTMVRTSALHSYEVLCDERLVDDEELMCDEEDEECWLSGGCQSPRTLCACVPVSDDSPFYCLEVGSLDPPEERGLEGDLLRASERTQVWWLVLKRCDTEADVFKRVGIGCRHMASSRQNELFSQSKVRTIRIV